LAQGNKITKDEYPVLPDEISKANLKAIIVPTDFFMLIFFYYAGDYRVAEVIDLVDGASAPIKVKERSAIDQKKPVNHKRRTRAGIQNPDALCCPRRRVATGLSGASGQLLEL
jgi:hypothetical protein